MIGVGGILAFGFEVHQRLWPLKWEAPAFRRESNHLARKLRKAVSLCSGGEKMIMFATACASDYYACHDKR